MTALGPSPLRAPLSEGHVDVNRYLGCGRYDACLDVAAQGDWASWTCVGCPRFRAHAVAAPARAAAVASPVSAHPVVAAGRRAPVVPPGVPRPPSPGVPIARRPRPESARPCASHALADRYGQLVVTLQAPSVPALFVEAGRAAAEVCGEAASDRASSWGEEVAVDAPDVPTLLGAWIRELVVRAERSGARFDEHDIVYLSERRLVASVRGSRLPDHARDPRCACHDPLIERRADGYRASVVLEV